jgi:hypothetical protein
MTGSDSFGGSLLSPDIKQIALPSSTKDEILSDKFIFCLFFLQIYGFKAMQNKMPTCIIPRAFFSSPLMLFSLFFLYSTAFPQKNFTLTEAEDSLRSLTGSFMAAGDENRRDSIHTLYKNFLTETLAIPGSFSYPFDSLATLSKLISPDESFRIYTWNLPLPEGQHCFHGIIQIPEKNGNGYRLVFLKDRSDSITSPEFMMLTSGTWYGAIYYNILRCQKDDGSVFYTLLGWHGENMFQTYKVIEILKPDRTGGFDFGSRVFCGFGNGDQVRVIFRYSSETTMYLSYEDQRVTISRSWNIKKRRFETETKILSLIVCDRLVPLDPRAENQFENYVPAADVVDGFYYDRNCWHYIKDIDARNPVP